MTARTMSVGVEGISDTQIVAVAGGEEKIGAIRSVLESGYLSGLITNERMAHALVNQTRPITDTNGRSPKCTTRKTS